MDGRGPLDLFPLFCSKVGWWKLMNPKKVGEENDDKILVGGIEVLWKKQGRECFCFFLGGWLGLLTGHVLDTHFYSFMYSMIELHIARIHRSPQRVSNFCVMVYTLAGPLLGKVWLFLSLFLNSHALHFVGSQNPFWSLMILSFDSWRFKGIRTKIGHCSLWCWVTHTTMFQIHVRLTSLQLPHSQVQTVQDLADLIWRTPRGLKLRTVDDETYIASLATKVGIKHMDFNSGRMVWCHY